MEKKRLLILLAMLVFAFPSVCAIYQEELYSGTVYPGQNVSIKNQTFRFNLGIITDRINVVAPSGSVIVGQGRCEVSDFFNICFDGIEFWYHNYTTDREYYTAKVKVSEIVAKIEIERAIASGRLFIGEETKIDAVFRNIGDRDAVNFVYNDEFSLNFTITDASGCVIDGNNVKWRGDLGTNMEKKCSYKIKALEKTVFSSKASAQYNEGIKKKAVNSTAIKITVPDHQLNVSAFLTDNEIYAGGSANLTVALENINPEKDIYVEYFKIAFPMGLKVANVPYRMRIDANRYSWSGTLLQDDKSIKFFFEIKAGYPDDYELATATSFILNNVRNEIKTLNKLKVRKAGQEPEAAKIEDIEEPQSNGSENIIAPEESAGNVNVGAEKATTTTTIPIESISSESKTEKMSPKKDSIIKRLFGNALFIIIDLIIVLFIIITIVKMIKAKKVG